MSEQFYTILTNIGKAKIANAISLGSEVNLVRFVVGDSNGSYYNPTEEQTELRRKVWETNSISVVNDEKNLNWIKIEAIIPGDVGGFTVREVGVFDDKNEMIAIGKIAEIYKPISENGSTKDVIIRMIIEVSNASAVTIKVDPTVMIATKKDIEVVESKFKKITGDKNELVTKNKSNLVAAINEVATGLNTIELTGNKVTIEDTDSNFVSGTVEGALKELSTKDKELDKRIADNKTEVDKEIADLKQYGSNVKEGFATVITSKGVTTDSSDTFETMINNVGSIKTKLPILEGDVGVTEDSEGNVYGVEKIEAIEEYIDNKNITSQSWRKDKEAASSLAIDSNGNIYSGPSNSSSGRFLDKLTTDGQIIWQKFEYESIRNIAISESDDIFFTTLSSNGQLIKINRNGDIIWRKNFQNINGVVIGEEHNIYISQVDRLIKIDYDANIIWERAFIGIGSIEYKNGYVYVNNSEKSNIAKISKLTTNNFLLWEYNHESPTSLLSNIAVDNEDNVYFSERVSKRGIVKLSSDGVKLWDFTTISCGTLTVSESGYIYGASGAFNGTLFKLTKEGFKLWDILASYTNKIISHSNNLYMTNDASGTSGAVLKMQDNFRIKKVAILKEREVTE